MTPQTTSRNRNTLLVVVLAALALTLGACGDAKPTRSPAEKWCGALRDRGALFEPMSRCVAEYERAQKP